MSLAAESRTAVAPLAFRRGADLPAGALGGRRLGLGAEALAARLLAPAHDVVDAWLGSGAVATRRHGCVQVATDSHWLHGVAEIDDRIDGLQAATHRAYTELFEVLADSACPNLLRLWNYLADINAERDGSERYRQFNAGRQQAFLEARRSAFDGAPAACALGTHGGPLRIYFLAGQEPPLAIENPRQVSAYRYPDAYGPRSPTFSRAALANVGAGRQVLFISGTASIVGHATVHLGDVRKQTEESLLNIATLLQAATERAGRPYVLRDLTATVYVRHAADLAVVREVFERTVGVGSPAALAAAYVEVDICRSDLLVEIEAHAFAPGGAA